jgi:hypothetical protein
MVDYPYEIVDMSRDKRGIAYLRKSETRKALTEEELAQAERIYNEAGVPQPEPQQRVTLPPHLMEQVEAWMKEGQLKVEPVD